MSIESEREGEIADRQLQEVELPCNERYEKEVEGQAGAEQAEWIEKYDETYNLYYYLNSVTGECQWDSPFTTDGCQDELLINNESYAEEDGHGDDVNLQGYVEGAEYEDDYTHELVDSDREKDYHQRQPDQELAYQKQLREYHEQKRNYTDAWNEHYASQPVYYTQEEQDYPYSHTQDVQEEDDFPYDYDSDEAADQYEHNDYEPYDEETAPKAVKDRSKDRLPAGTSQDYVHMARMYKLTRPYSDPDYTALCVLCHTNFADMVFFPCEHRCVCSECIHNESICADKEMETTPHGYCNCSLCAGIIKLILPSEGGAEVEKYWDWVYEEQIPLPSTFLRNFRHSAGVIRAVHVRNGDGKDVDSFENASKSCAIT